MQFIQHRMCNQEKMTPKSSIMLICRQTEFSKFIQLIFSFNDPFWHYQINMSKMYLQCNNYTRWCKNEWKVRLGFHTHTYLVMRKSNPLLRDNPVTYDNAVPRDNWFLHEQTIINCVWKNMFYRCYFVIVILISQFLRDAFIVT